ncbi:dynein regulation protein LC7 [Sphaerisporangium siamense]|uniref:Putative regulator of Ras-like GTPase activity (Roadblock/LC7/MglB family) n=1 Tax=Sphaerisporangium siamense TaxID=795645 RepID=A0A7W7DDY7_9ACTN|nr:roadblock/LC7 domain-containing protein [Sphaerisporangium siamense]MBB4705057.1 putative regulator of Ras-like GTPase activity (Roadblock/LC7/MglB family) [Sphaerisporangium siamense]GII83863.1 dynein regulation protein LC7 [Sphaerisporangium siamense]
MQRTSSPADLTWLLDDLVHRVREAEHGIVLSTDGLLLAASRGLSRPDAEHLSAVAAGVQSLAQGASERFQGGAVRQTIIAMRSAYLVVTVAGEGACLAVLAAQDADVGLVAYEMAMLVARVGQYLTSPARTETLPPRNPPRNEDAL